MFRVVEVAVGLHDVATVDSTKLKLKGGGAEKQDLILDGGTDQILLHLAVNLDKRL